MTLIFTCGEPLSINIEAFLRAVVPSMSRHQQIIGIGSLWQLEHQAAALGLKIPDLKIIKNFEQLKSSGVFWLDSSPQSPRTDARNLDVFERGKMAWQALQAVPKSWDGPLAVLTAPINKKSASAAGFPHPGQTEYFESLWDREAVMLLAGPSLRVALATNHLPLIAVSQKISTSFLVRKIDILQASFTKLYGIKNPRIAVCGLNPHCGDDGLFGDEDKTIIEPAVKKSQESGFAVTGPLAADTVFVRSMRGEFDVVLAMYHDQGLGPLKTVHFDDAVNVSLGLPYLRVSPDHGPAADLFLTGKATMKSFDAALKLCDRYLGGLYGT